MLERLERAARVLLGTIYLPRGMLLVSNYAGSSVADQSAYTIIIAGRIQVSEGPKLYMNANYGGTTIQIGRAHV